MTQRLILSAALIAISATTHAQTKQAPINTGKAYVKILTTYTKHEEPAVKERVKRGDDHCVIIWKGDTYPTNFSWRAVSSFAPCSVEKAHKTRSGYIVERISSDAIHKGDTLMLRPLIGARTIIPDEIPASAHNALFFKTADTPWLSMQLKKTTIKKEK